MKITVCEFSEEPKQLAWEWERLVGGRAAAVVSGAYCLSSNRTSPAGTAYGLGGQGWIVDPDGDVMGLTSPQEHYLTLEIDLERAERAKRTYPRYVQE